MSSKIRFENECRINHVNLRYKIIFFTAQNRFDSKAKLIGFRAVIKNIIELIYNKNTL